MDRDTMIAHLELHGVCLVFRKDSHRKPQLWPTCESAAPPRPVVRLLHGEWRGGKSYLASSRVDAMPWSALSDKEVCSITDEHVRHLLGE